MFIQVNKFYINIYYIFNENELDKNSVCSNIKHTAEDGKFMTELI